MADNLHFFFFFYSFFSDANLEPFDEGEDKQKQTGYKLEVSKRSNVTFKNIPLTNFHSAEMEISTGTAAQTKITKRAPTCCSCFSVSETHWTLLIGRCIFPKLKTGLFSNASETQRQCFFFFCEAKKDGPQRFKRNYVSKITIVSTGIKRFSLLSRPMPFEIIKKYITHWISSKSGKFVSSWN